MFVTYVTEIDNKIINNNVGILCMTFVDKEKKNNHWSFQGKESVKPHI